MKDAMNEEQRAVLETVARMEQHPSGSIDEYTVARASGVLARDLSGQDWLHAAERDHIRSIFDSLEDDGLLRIDRTGYWRPRTSLAGRRIVQGLPAAVVPHRTTPSAAWRDEPAAESYPLRPAPAGDNGPAERPTRLEYPEKSRAADRAWPAWWPAALRIGDPNVTPIAAPVVIIALLLMIVLGARVLGSRGSSPAPTATVSAQATATTGGPIGVPTSAAGSGATPGAGGTRPGTTATTARPTRGPQAAATQAVIIPQVMIANTDNEGAFLFATPAGEKMDVAVPEGTLVDDIGPDEQDPYGVTWKHIRFGDAVGWVPKQYTAPVKSGQAQ